MDLVLTLSIALALSGATSGGYADYRVETGYICSQNQIVSPDGELWFCETDDMSVGEACVMVYDNCGTDYLYDDEIVWIATREEYVVSITDFREDGLVSAYDIGGKYYFSFEAPEGAKVGDICALTIYADVQMFEDVLWETAEIIRR